MSFYSSVLNDFIALFFPRLCLACQQQIPPREQVICISCQYHLPKTKFHLERENAFTERFWGRIPID
ncbi:MAG: ComF family protein, partial [Bacteroidota bacterium]